MNGYLTFLPPTTRVSSLRSTDLLAAKANTSSCQICSNIGRNEISRGQRNAIPPYLPIDVLNPIFFHFQPPPSFFPPLPLPFLLSSLVFSSFFTQKGPYSGTNIISISQIMYDRFIHFVWIVTREYMWSILSKFWGFVQLLWNYEINGKYWEMLKERVHLRYFTNEK